MSALDYRRGLCTANQDVRNHRRQRCRSRALRAYTPCFVQVDLVALTSHATPPTTVIRSGSCIRYIFSQFISFSSCFTFFPLSLQQQLHSGFFSFFFSRSFIMTRTAIYSALLALGAGLVHGCVPRSLGRLASVDNLN